MAVLPGNKAMELGDLMSKNGIGAMKSPEPSADEADGDESLEAMEGSDYGDSELDLCVDDLTQAFASGDKEAFRSALMDLIDVIKSGDLEQDEQLGL